MVLLHTPGIEDPFGITLLVRIKSADHRPSPTEDRDNKRNQKFIACWKAPHPHCVWASRQELPICSVQSVRTTEDGSSRHVHSLFVSLQGTVLIFEGLWYVDHAVPPAVLGPVRFLRVAFGGSFLP